MKRLLRRRSLVINGTLGVLLVAGIGVGYLSLTGGDDSAGASALSRTTQVVRGTVVSSVSASGSVDSAKSRSLSFTASGTVAKIYVQAGDKVSKGELLARLDTTSAQENLTSAKANLSAAADGDTSSASGYSSYVSAKNAYNQAVRALAGTELRAPFAGTVAVVNGTVGGSSSGSGSSGSSSGSQSSGSSGGSSGGGSGGGSGASSGSSSTSSSSSSSSGSGFVELADPKKLQVTGEFTEADAIKLKAGQRATVSFDALSGVTATGKVTQIDMSPTTSNNVVEYGATITLTTIPGSVRIGQTATVQVTTATAQNVLYVPAAAVRTAGGQSTVTVLQGGKQVIKPVQTGVKGGQGTEIKSGLNEGDQVVITTTTTSTSGSSGFGRAGGGLGGGGIGGGGAPGGGAGGGRP
ncbi:HlyD family efflux transporter periplasmic adaptor subunit [Actinoallomurus purpureus]|uniref:efflux RND transporter periplasmic adaptor subunit n=1 Tax=Actinoallomurus purpureus TaxID=478114 RepID=UPI0020921395|nr:HlyD family efflux transporter periplasmic adaptor subunit [Actinoallomurus purpureus]MCO6004288.1 HlyD family efflux transporter periplasmic adaptor subunit [Actinoallomurus purpureus]